MNKSIKGYKLLSQYICTCRWIYMIKMVSNFLPYLMLEIFLLKIIMNKSIKGYKLLSQYTQLTIGRFLNVLRKFQVRSMDVLSKRLKNVLLWKVLDVNKTFQMDVQKTIYKLFKTFKKPKMNLSKLLRTCRKPLEHYGHLKTFQKYF